MSEKVIADEKDTIAAISTPHGSGGIAVIRISGSKAVSVADAVFSGRKRIHDLDSHCVTFGRIKDESFHPKEGLQGRNLFIDEVLVSFYRAPNSYTGEDVVEISCHGGVYVSHKILEQVLKQDARAANPGEFTQRAFLNGRMDLSQAEGVADIIAAKTRFSLMAAIQQYNGTLRKKVETIRTRLVNICTLIELELDFAEENMIFTDTGDLSGQLKQVQGDIADFLRTYRCGRILREGAKLIIVGKPNVGKSSLLNALLKEERAIVTDIAGTTRDAIEEQIDIKGVYFRIIDTAGVRHASDDIERIGIKRTLGQLENADIVLLVLDSSRPFDSEDRYLVEQIVKLEKADSCCVVINKCDLESSLSEKDIRKYLPGANILSISATQRIGFGKLEEVLSALTLNTPEVTLNGAMITNRRQKLALEAALKNLRRATCSLEKQISSEFVVIDIKEAMDHLAEIIGRVSSEDVLDNIFSKFCVGK